MDPLLQPFSLKHLTLRNRIVSTAHAPSFEEGGHPRERYRVYHEEKARGGVALTMIGGSTNIAPDSPSVFGQLYAGDDSIVPWFQQLTRGVHRHGAAVMCQITHMGRRTAWDNGHWLPVLGPSGVRERAHRSQPKAMELEDINRVIANYADAARRCQRGGFDGVELLSHSHLLGQFLSPLVNRREDDYGGSLANRLRLSLQVVEAVRDAVGPEFIVGMRLTGDELIDGGLSEAECLEVAKRVSAPGGVDFLNILAGAPYDDLGLAGWVAPMGTASAPHLSVARAIRSAVDVPVMHAGSVADLATARHALQSDCVDLIGMTRAHIADPALIQKLKDDQEERIRPCVGLGYCVDRVNQGKAMVCGHNAATGREAWLPHTIEPAPAPGRVVVVGGGPAGLEAARVSALRGNKVTLFEATDRLGGQLNLASASTTRRQVAGAVDWLQQEIAHLGVDVRLNHYADAADVLALDPTAVLVATGALPRGGRFPGSGLAHDSWAILSRASRVAGEVLLFDEIGDQAAAVCAEFLAESGCQLSFATPDRAILQELGPTTSSVCLKALAKAGVRFDCWLEIDAIEAVGQRKHVTFRHALTGERSVRHYDEVVLELGVEPMEELYFDLKGRSRNLGQLEHAAMTRGENPFVDRHPAGGFWLARLGDAVAGRNIHAAIFDASRCCRFI